MRRIRRRRSAGLGAALQRPRTGRAGRWEVTGRTLEGRRSHWRRLLRPARSRRSTASCAGGARTWRGGSWRRSHLHETVGRELKALGFAKISARPRHYAQNELAVEAFKKNFPAELAKIRARLPKGVELWWLKPASAEVPRRRWHAPAGAPRPRTSLYLRPIARKMRQRLAAHLIEISAAGSRDAVLIVDQAVGT